ncbi:MAG: GDSL-type esterase/lipase family protein [Novosphingobium sp.]|uniref:GDSL-type esterase/lipase family protein n=1 Tax=Novosphingobium sp. TaxID=1874826 RepID=UPI0032B87035
MKFIHIACATAILSAVCLGLSAPASARAQTAFVAERPTPRVDYWQKRSDDITRTLRSTKSLKDVRLLFVGDSITDFWHLDANPWFKGKWCGRQVWDESFSGRLPEHKALNLGVSGDRIEHVLHRILPKAKGGSGWLDRQDLQPDTVFLLLGINNSFDAEDPAVESIFSGVRATIAAIRARKPKARIVVQSLLPTDDPAKNAALVQPINARLRALVSDAGPKARMEFLDLYPSFVDAAGLQRKSLFNDSLHPSLEGYAVWRDRLIAFLAGRSA